jgi:hypothetical protein
VVKGVGEELVDMDRADRWGSREADHQERVDSLHVVDRRAI